jgi:hypothetical protein
MRQARPARRRAVRRERHRRHVRPADRMGHSDPQGPQARARRRLRRAVAQSRRGSPRQNRHHRIREPPSRPDPQSARSHPHARGLVERLGRRGRRLHGADCDRDANHRLDHPPGVVLRRVRLSPDLGRAPAARRHGGVGLARHARHPGAVGPGHRALSRRAARHRPRAGFGAGPTAARRPLPYPCLGAGRAHDAPTHRRRGAAACPRRRQCPRCRAARRLRAVE